MTSNDKTRPMSAIIGDRLKTFREERDLRQSDISAAAAACGLSWSRSSIAALEAGTRNLAFEEILLLPLVISNAGGWEKPLLPPDSMILIAPGRHVVASEITGKIGALTGGVRGNVPEARLVEDVEQQEIYLLGQDSAGGENVLDNARMYARYAAWRLFIASQYSSVGYDEVMSSSVRDRELQMKVAERLNIAHPLADAWSCATFFPWILWGRPLQVERDARTAQRGEYETKRSLQAARGHATREMIAELNEEIDQQRSCLVGIFSQLEQVWDDPDETTHWRERAERVATRLKNKEALEKRSSEEKAQWSELGSSMRAARESHGIDVADFARKASIRPDLIREMEDGDFLSVDHRYALMSYVMKYVSAFGLNYQPYRRLLDWDEAASGMESLKGAQRRRLAEFGKGKSGR